MKYNFNTEMLQRLILMLFLGLLFAQCKSKSPIITSKNEAIKRGNYRTGYAKSNSEKEESKKSKVDKSIGAENLETVTLERKESKRQFDKSNYKNLSKTIENILETAFSYEGTKYRAGGTTAKGMDCSGLVYTSFLANDITLPRSSFDMAKVGEKLKEKDYQVGDLIFFVTGRANRISHVGIITEIKDDNEIIFIHSSTQKGVIFSSTKEPYYQKTFAQVNRVL
jgi:cell wall-associated NlpC family hydrolase